MICGRVVFKERGLDGGESFLGRGMTIKMEGRGGKK